MLIGANEKLQQFHIYKYLFHISKKQFLVIKFRDCQLSIG